MWRSRLPESPEDTSGDAALIERLQSAGLSLQPGHVEESRERLFLAVAQQRAASRPVKERAVFDLLLGKKRLALVAADVLAIGAVGAVGASGGVSDAAGNVNDVLAALNITDKTPDVADGHIDAIEQPDGAGEDANDNANENASDGAENADDGINNGDASDTGLDNAADNASDGSGNADDAPDGLPDLPDDADGALDDVDPGVPADAPVDDHADLPDEASDPPVPVP